LGRPAGDSGYAVTWHGYAIQLCVGGTIQANSGDFAPTIHGGEVIVEVVDTTSPPIDGWMTAKLKYTPNPANDGLSGVAARADQFACLRLRTPSAHPQQAQHSPVCH
jgi:hypothetical protein